MEDFVGVSVADAVDDFGAGEGAFDGVVFCGDGC